MVYAPAELEVDTPNSSVDDAFTRYYFTFDLDLGFKVMCSVTHYPQHYVIYTPVKFEGAMSKG